MRDLIYKIKSRVFRYSKEANKYKRPSYDELLKYKNFERKNNNNLALAFGAGRCGLSWFSKIFNSHKNWVGSVERFADYEAFYRYITYYNLPVNRESFYKLMELSYKRDMALYQNTFISSSYLSFGVKELTEKLNPNYIFFNIRNPINSVESFYKKGWYFYTDGNKNMESPSIDITNSQYRSFSRIIPTGEKLKKWKDLSRIGKISFFWATINKSIYDDFKKINNIDKYNVKLEDINQNYSIYENLVEKFDFKEKLKKNKFLEIINKAPNKGSKDKYLYKDWNDLEKKEFTNVINEIFPYYESIKTDI